MTKGLWLYPIMLPFAGGDETLLGSTLRLVCRSFGIDSCAIRPREIEGPGEIILLYKNGQCSLVPSDKLNCSQFNLIKMTCGSAFEFADFYSAAVEQDLSEEAHKIFSSFCKIFYNELLGGFVSSDAPLTMEVVGISKNFNAYPGSGNTIENVNFKIHQGQFTVLMGPSGCGKSTILNIMGGLLRPTSGSVYFHEGSLKNDVCQFTKKEITEYRRNSVSFIFQNYNLIDDLTAWENVKISESLAARPQGTQEALESVGMLGKKDSYPFRLSGGEQQRICIARALVKNAGLLLCDEPTGALDTVNSKNIITILQREAKRRNVAVVMVTHNPDYETIADHYIEMKNGNVVIDDYRPFPFDADKIL